MQLASCMQARLNLRSRVIYVTRVGGLGYACALWTAPLDCNSGKFVDLGGAVFSRSGWAAFSRRPLKSHLSDRKSAARVALIGLFRRYSSQDCADDIQCMEDGTGFRLPYSKCSRENTAKLSSLGECDRVPEVVTPPGVALSETLLRHLALNL